jgi:hypothetical protein
MEENKIKKNNLTFLEFCNELRGLEIYYKNKIISKFLLFWNKIKVDEILSKGGNFKTKERT